MISGGRFLWFLMIFELIFDQFLSTFLHFFEKSKKLQNHCFYYGFGRISHAEIIQNTSKIRPRKRMPPKVVKCRFFDDFGPRLGSQNNPKTHENQHSKSSRKNIEKKLKNGPKVKNIWSVGGIRGPRSLKSCYQFGFCC